MTLRRIEGRLADSIHELDQAIARTTNPKPNYINNLGLSYFENDQMIEAEAQFNRAIQE